MESVHLHISGSGWTHGRAVTGARGGMPVGGGSLSSGGERWASNNSAVGESSRLSSQWYDDGFGRVLWAV